MLLARWSQLRLARQELFEVQFLDSLILHICHLYISLAARESNPASLSNRDHQLTTY